MYSLSGYPMLASMATTLMLSIIFMVLSHQSGKTYMKIWGYSWLICTVIFLVDFFHLAYLSDEMAYIMLRQLFAVIASYLFLMGTYRFFQIKLDIGFGIGTLVSTAVITLYPVSHVLYSLALVPNVIFCSGMLIVSACMFITVSWTQRLPEKIIASFLIICWSIFINHFGFGLKNMTMAIVTYYLGIFTVNALMIVILLVYFQKLRFIDSLLSARFRLLVENSSDSMFLYDYKKQEFEYISPTISELVGLSARKLYEAPERFFEKANVEKANQNLVSIFSSPVQEPGMGVLCLYRDGAVSKWSEIHYVPIRDNIGNVTAVEGILRDITERKRMENEISQAEEARKELLDNISHEIKTPITLITGYSESLVNGAVPEESSDIYLKMINSKALMLANLMDDLTHVSDITSQSMEYKFYETTAAEVFEEMMNQVELHIMSSNHIGDVACRVDSNAVIIADSYRLQQVVTNMVNNAIRHTPFGGEINVTCITRANDVSADADEYQDVPKGSVVFTVSDRGSGIDEETLPHIFERRYSGSKRLETNTGLGLYISNQIILQHSGHMDAANNRFGGADISFTIPYY